MADAFPGLTDIHAHPGMNAFLWDRDLRRHYFTGKAFNPLASLSDFKMLREGDVRVLWSSLYVVEPGFFTCPLLRFAAHFTSGGRTLRKLDAWQCLLVMMADMERQVARAGPEFELARSNADLDRIVAAGRRAIVHTVESGHVLSASLAAGDLDGRAARIKQLADRGVASLTLAHLFPNDLAGHAEAIPDTLHNLPICSFDTGVDPAMALTDAGRAVVEAMVEHRVICDVTHCTKVAREEVYARVGNRAPIVASHSGVQALNPVEYNLDEADVRAIAATGGVVGVIFMPYWLEAAHPGPGLEAVWQTMDTIRGWSGGTWDHVAIGTDFDGFTDPPDDCDSEAQLPLVRELLERKGVGGADADAILGGNARRVLRAGWR